MTTAMPDAPVCWKCAGALTDVPLPLSRRAVCPACRAELRVCRMCRHYDTAKAKHCRETAADEVRDKTRANFCDWFQPRYDAYVEPPNRANSAPLATLFGDDTAPETPRDTRQALDDLFG